MPLFDQISNQSNSLVDEGTSAENQVSTAVSSITDPHTNYTTKPASQGESLNDSYRLQTPRTNAYVQGYIETNQVIPDIMSTAQKQLDDYSVSDAIGISSLMSYDDIAFKYGVTDNYAISYEDPTFPKFQLSFTASDKGDLNLFPQASNFINAYSSINDIANRANMLSEFNRIFFSIFNSDFTVKNLKNYNKSHYINTIDGLNKLNVKIVDYKGQKGLKPEGDDYITITLSEDVSYLSLYMAELYNNLHYDYKGQRYMIPDNCLRFNMSIKISDIRNFKIMNPDYKSTDPLSNLWIYDNNVSNIIYNLYDCNIVFAESQNIVDNLTIAGFGASLPNDPATLKFHIYYKSVGRQISPMGLNNYYILDSKGASSKDGMVMGSNNILDKTKVFGNQQISNSDISQKTKSAVGQFLTKAGNSLVAGADELINRTIRNVRGELVNSLVGEIRSVLQVPQIYPEWIPGYHGMIVIIHKNWLR